jgi:hypothetical protein
MECRNLAAKASCYVQLHLQRGSDDTIAPLQAGKEGEQKKHQKRDIPEMELGVTVRSPLRSSCTSQRGCSDIKKANHDHCAHNRRDKRE